jgi:L-ascorbate metabolism protein UlaG (beta-lactamase superfamily)
MKLTKYTHACLVLEEQEQKLVIDPGSWTPDFGPLEGIVAVVVTHNHLDHFNMDNLTRIKQANPGVKLFGAAEVAQDASALGMNIVTGGQGIKVGAFNLQFFGDMHAVIHSSFPPVPHNIGVLVNNNLYYPGDSLTIPADVAIQVLATPVSAPWLKMGEVVDFVTAVKPQRCFATHNAILSEQGQTIADNQMSAVCQQIGAEYLRLKTSQTITI